jgi:hypothetical protein
MLTFLSVLTIKLRGKKLNMCYFSLSYCLCQFVTGTGKSQFLKFSAKLSNRSVITTGLGSTSAGLTVTAVKDGGNFDTALFFSITVSFSIIHNFVELYFVFVTKIHMAKCSLVNFWDSPPVFKPRKLCPFCIQFS